MDTEAQFPACGESYHAAVSEFGQAQSKPRRPDETVLYKLVAENWETFQARVHDTGRSLPKHVVKEFYDFLDCGILARGFFRVRCGDCHKEKLLALACRARGFCPSCMGRRMNETAVFLVDHVLPQLPIRQWVLSFPFAIRYILAKNPKHVSRVLRITLRVIEGFYKKRGKLKNSGPVSVGSVTAIQRFGGSVNLNVHFHALVPDGVFYSKVADRKSFARTAAPEDCDIEKMVAQLAKRILSYFRRQGLIQNDYLNEEQAEFIDELSSASVSSKIAFGERSGQRVRKYGQLDDQPYSPKLTGPLCASFEGFSLHAATCCEIWQKGKLENLAKYINRPPIANDRLTLTQSGQVLYKMKSPYQDGTTHLIFEPLEFIEKLCALVPPPRMHMIRYHGVFAPNSKVRSQIVKRNKVPKKPKDGENINDPILVPEKLKSRISWAKLMSRVFQIDVTKCKHCGGKVKVLAATMEKQAIVKILKHLGLPSEPPEIAPARAPPQGSFDWH